MLIWENRYGFAVDKPADGGGRSALGESAAQFVPESVPIIGRRFLNQHQFFFNDIWTVYSIIITFLFNIFNHSINIQLSLHFPPIYSSIKLALN